MPFIRMIESFGNVPDDGCRKLADFTQQPAADRSGSAPFALRAGTTRLTPPMSSIAGLIRILRANLLDEISKPYVLAARARGVPEKKLYWKYPLHIALISFGLCMVSSCHGRHKLHME